MNPDDSNDDDEFDAEVEGGFETWRTASTPAMRVVATAPMPGIMTQTEEGELIVVEGQPGDRDGKGKPDDGLRVPGDVFVARSRKLLKG
jgi:hypothetical protein